jgi:DMSO/TMAO reductase YedYZ heme-binding membrane subunit
MELIFNTANPLVLMVYVLVTATIIFIGRKLEQAWPLIALMVYTVGLLVYHSVTLDGLVSGSEMISTVYHCIAFDLILILLTFISYLWVDDIIAKKRKLKSYDDSLSWFWNKI